MAQASKNTKFVPLRLSQLLPDILAAVQDEEEDEYESGSDGEPEYPDKSFSDGDIVEHNRGFYKASHKTDVTHPISNRCKEHNVENFTDENFYNQTYPNKESQNASATKNKSKLMGTPLRTPNKHNTIIKQVTASGRSVRGAGATPRSSNKKKTPRYMKGLGPGPGMSLCKSSAKKTTPFRKCLNLEDAFKSSTKASLFSTSKPHPTPSHHQTIDKGTSNHSERDIKPSIKPTALDEIFATALQITDEQNNKGHCDKEKETLGPPVEKGNPFGNKHNHKNYHNMFATPKTNVTSNSIIKGCRDNNFVTPLKPTDVSGVHKYETPSTQNSSSLLFRKQQTPLFPIKEKNDGALKQSMKKVEMSQRKNKENQLIITDKDVQHKKSLFKDISDVHDKLAVLKDLQNSGGEGKTPIIKQTNSIFKQDASKKLIAATLFKQQDNLVEKQTVNNDAIKSHHDEPHPTQDNNKPHFFHSQLKQHQVDKENQHEIDKKNTNNYPQSVGNFQNNVHSNALDPNKENPRHFVSNKPTSDRMIQSNQFNENEHRQQQKITNDIENMNLHNRLSAESNNQRHSMVDGNFQSSLNQRISSDNNFNHRDEKNRIVDNMHNRLSVESGLQQLQHNRNDWNQPLSHHRPQVGDGCNSAMRGVQQIAGVNRQFKTLTIKGKQYIVLGSLGSGGSSEVFKVMDPDNSSMYAVKCVNLAVEQSVAQSYVNEIKLLQKLQGSDRVITMYDYEFVEKRTLYVLLEMGEVDLSKLMKGYRLRESRLPLPILMCYWTEMLTAVRHIHQNGIIHSDLKPANFLLVHGRLKLIDFGIASSLNADATSVLKDSPTGTFNYISPEAVNAGSEGRDPFKISYKSDVWSLGCILYSMLYGRTPFSHVNHIMAKIRALCNPHQPIDYPEIQGIPPVLMQALRWCLTHDVKKRPSVQQLIELPYMGEVSPPISNNNKKVPMSIMLKLKDSLSPEDLACVIDVLSNKKFPLSKLQDALTPEELSCVLNILEGK